MPRKESPTDSVRLFGCKEPSAPRRHGSNCHKQHLQAVEDHCMVTSVLQCQALLPINFSFEVRHRRLAAKAPDSASSTRRGLNYRWLKSSLDVHKRPGLFFSRDVKCFRPAQQLLEILHERFRSSLNRFRIVPSLSHQWLHQALLRLLDVGEAPAQVCHYTAVLNPSCPLNIPRSAAGVAVHQTVELAGFLDQDLSTRLNLSAAVLPAVD